MSVNIKLNKGFNINLAGKAEKKVAGPTHPDTVALKPMDFIGMTRPKVLVKEGQNVKSGTPLFFDKGLEGVIYTAPVSGEIVEVKRGDQRALLEIRILADKKIEFEEFKKHSVSEIAALTRDAAADLMKKSGVWPNIIQRPFGIVANPADTPKSIFISGFDSHPLAPDYGFIFKGEEKYMQAGVDVLSKFTKGVVHLNVDAQSEMPGVFSQIQNVRLNKFSGKHPAGNVGVQIHHLDPINKGDIAWTLHPYGVIQIGKLFLEGRYDASKTIAVAGSEVSSPQYYKTFIGASVDKFLEGNLKQKHVRVISGNVLTGQKISSNSYMGYYDHLISVLPEGDKYEFLGWIMPSATKLSIHRSFGLFSFLNPNKEYTLDTNMQGQERAFVLTGVLEKVLPMDILPVYLLKAIMASDFDEIESLGIYELIEEDLALCEFVDVSKLPVQEILREGINIIRES